MINPLKFICYAMIILVILYAAGCNRQGNVSTATIGKHQFIIETVCSQSAQALGLSGRTSLPEGTGMLFIYNQPGYYRIWMKEMNFPIDIMWINEFKSVVHIETNVHPDSYPETFVSPTPALYVLEIPFGASKGIDLYSSVQLRNILSDEMPCR